MIEVFYSYQIKSIDSKVSFPFHLYRVSFLEAVEATRERVFTDPCAPKGYNLDTNTQKHLSGLLAEESRFSDSFQAGGNYSECRSAALTILQEGNGRILIDIAGFPFRMSTFFVISNKYRFLLLNAEKCLYQHCSIGSTFTPKLQGSFLATENFFHTSKVLLSLISDFTLVMYI